MTYKTSAKGVVALLGHEGVVPGPYLDSKGIWTYGCGHTAAAGAPIPYNMTRGMPKDLDSALDEVFTVFAADLRSYEDAVARALKVHVSQHEFDALISFHFNTGAIARAEVTRYLNLGNRKSAAKAFMNWKTPKEIIDRRKSEMKLFETGEYPSSKISVWEVKPTGKLAWRLAKRLSPSEALDMMSGHWNEKLVPQIEEPEDEGLPEVDFETGTPLLGIGSKGDEVRYAQTLLCGHGFNTLIDGNFGRGTKATVEAFQKAKKLSIDGKIGPQTWAALRNRS